MVGKQNADVLNAHADMRWKWPLLYCCYAFRVNNMIIKHVLPGIIFLQCPHQGAYHIIKLGFFGSSITRDLKFIAVKYFEGWESQSLGSGSVKYSLSIFPSRYDLTKVLTLSSETVVSAGLNLIGGWSSFMVTILMVGKVSLLILCLTPRNSNMRLWSRVYKEEQRYLSYR